MQRKDMENIEQLKQRKEEIEGTLERLAELMQKRNDILTCYEKNIFHKTINHMFSNLNASSRGMMSSLTLIKKNYELDLRLFRRGQFYLQKRKRFLLEELDEIMQILNQSAAETTNPSPSI